MGGYPPKIPPTKCPHNAPRRARAYRTRCRPRRYGMGRGPYHKTRLGRVRYGRNAAPSVRRASAPSSPVGSRMRSLRSRKRRAKRAKRAPKARRERAKGAPATRRLPPPLRGESDGARYPGRPPSRIISQQSQNRLQQPAI